jgi:hypothetical protein
VEPAQTFYKLGQTNNIEARVKMSGTSVHNYVAAQLAKALLGNLQSGFQDINARLQARMGEADGFTVCVDKLSHPLITDARERSSWGQTRASCLAFAAVTNQVSPCEGG